MAELKTLQKAKKKRWYPIHARGFNDAFLGETLASNEKGLLGRVVSANLASLTGDIKRQSVTLRFEIRSVKEGKGYADVVGYALSNTAIKRLVRRNVERVDMSLLCQTADNVKVRIKTFILTRSATGRGVLNSLHKASIESLTKSVGKLKYDDLVVALIEHKLQSELKHSLSKVYPLKSFEIKMFGFALEEKKQTKDNKATIPKVDDEK
jgi:ribosomal protein S3AE